MKRNKIQLKSKNKRRIIVALLIFVIIIGVFIYNINRNKTSNILNRVSKYVDINKDNVSVDFKTLKKINKDIVAYVKIDNTDIEYPVVKAKDNDYYTNHNLYKKKNSEGWVFVDYRCKVDGLDKNLIIYGNNTQKDSMFGNTIKTLNSIMYKDDIFITVAMEKENAKYKVFSVYQVKTDTYYNRIDFNTNSFLTFANIVKKRSIRDFKVEISNKDNILTLATCKNSGDYILVVHAKKI